MTLNKLDLQIHTNVLYLLKSEAELATGMLRPSSMVSFGDILFIYFVNSNGFT